MKFFRQLFNPDHQETNGDVLFFRIFEILIIYQVLFYAWDWGMYIPKLGDVVLPLGIAQYIDISFMFAGPYSIINAALITVFAILGFLNRGRFFYILAVFAMHLQYVARYSQGEISHGSNFTVTALVCFALTAIFFESKTHRRKIAMGLFIFFIGLGYTSAAFCKLVGTGLTWVDGRHLYLWMGERATDHLSQHGFYEFNILQEITLQHHWLATITLIFGVLTEFLGFLLWFRKTRPYQATFLIALHVGIYLTMSINFRSYLFILLVVGYPWGIFFDWLLQQKSFSRLNAYLARQRT